MPATPYILTKIGLTKAQVRKLANGHGIQLTAAAIRHGSHPVHLTRTQINHLQKAAAAGKGARLSFSAKQTRHHIKMGAGFFSDFAKGFRDGFSTVINAGSKIIAKVPLLEKAAGPLAALAGITSRGEDAWKY